MKALDDIYLLNYINLSFDGDYRRSGRSACIICAYVHKMRKLLADSQ